MCDIYNDDETATLWNVTYPRARVEHRCACCCRTIPRGDNYALTKTLYDSAWTTEKTCAGCATAITAFGDAHRYYPAPSMFREYLEECLRDEESNHWAPVLAFVAGGSVTNPS